MEQHSHLEGTEFVVMSHELIKIKKEVVEDEIELQKNTNNEYKITEGSGQVTIKNEDDVQSFTNQNADICSNSTANDLASTNIWIKCEPIEELKLENDLDIETCGGTEITEECLIKNEDEHIVKRRRAGRSQKHIICVHCNMTFTINRSLDDHMIRKHPDLIAEVSSKIHACAHCKYKTTRRVRLLQHMLKHPGAEGGYKLKKCVHCNGEFRYTTTLDNHIIQKHPEHIKLVSSKIHECKYCVFKTTTKGHLTKHMRNHPGAEGGCHLKMCIHCSAIFKDKISLDEHIIKKHPEYIASVSSKIHECKHCAFKTTSKSHLVSHLGKHPEAENVCERKVCISCNATFANKVNLDNHIIKKHPEGIASISHKIHECKYCKFKTTKKSDLSRHIMKYHEEEGGSELETCIHCHALFQYKRSLDDHIIKKHPGYISSVSNKVHECVYCMYKTTFKGKLTRHMLEHPGADSSRNPSV